MGTSYSNPLVDSTLVFPAPPSSYGLDTPGLLLLRSKYIPSREVPAFLIRPRLTPTRRGSAPFAGSLLSGGFPSRSHLSPGVCAAPWASTPSTPRPCSSPCVSTQISVETSVSRPPISRSVLAPARQKDSGSDTPDTGNSGSAAAGQPSRGKKGASHAAGEEGAVGAEALLGRSSASSDHSGAEIEASSASSLPDFVFPRSSVSHETAPSSPKAAQALGGRGATFFEECSGRSFDAHGLDHAACAGQTACGASCGGAEGRRKDGKGFCLLYFHGNACDANMMRDWLQIVADELGVTVLIFEYPGYGLLEDYDKSSRGIDLCARIAFEFLVDKLLFPIERIILCGRSIGTGAAAWLASQLAQCNVQVGGLVLVSPYVSLAAVASDWADAPLVLTEVLVHHHWNNEAAIASIPTVPLCIIHGKEDDVIPVAHAKRLWQAARQPPSLRVARFADGNHNVGMNLESFYGDILVPLQVFFRKVSSNLRTKKAASQTRQRAVETASAAHLASRAHQQPLGDASPHLSGGSWKSAKAGGGRGRLDRTVSGVRHQGRRQVSPRAVQGRGSGCQGVGKSGSRMLLSHRLGSGPHAKSDEDCEAGIEGELKNSLPSLASLGSRRRAVRVIQGKKESTEEAGSSDLARALGAMDMASLETRASSSPSLHSFLLADAAGPRDSLRKTDSNLSSCADQSPIRSDLPPLLPTLKKRVPWRPTTVSLNRAIGSAPSPGEKTTPGDPCFSKKLPRLRKPGSLPPPVFVLRDVKTLAFPRATTDGAFAGSPVSEWDAGARRRSSSSEGSCEGRQEPGRLLGHRQASRRSSWTAGDSMCMSHSPLSKERANVFIGDRHSKFLCRAMPARTVSVAGLLHRGKHRDMGGRREESRGRRLGKEENDRERRLSEAGYWPSTDQSVHPAELLVGPAERGATAETQDEPWDDEEGEAEEEGDEREVDDEGEDEEEFVGTDGSPKSRARLGSCDSLLAASSLLEPETSRLCFCEDSYDGLQTDVEDGDLFSDDAFASADSTPFHAPHPVSALLFEGADPVVDMPLRCDTEATGCGASDENPGNAQKRPWKVEGEVCDFSGRLAPDPAQERESPWQSDPTLLPSAFRRRFFLRGKKGFDRFLPQQGPFSSSPFFPSLVKASASPPAAPSTKALLAPLSAPSISGRRFQRPSLCQLDTPSCERTPDAGKGSGAEGFQEPTAPKDFKERTCPRSAATAALAFFAPDARRHSSLLAAFLQQETSRELQRQRETLARTETTDGAGVRGLRYLRLQRSSLELAGAPAPGQSPISSSGASSKPGDASLVSRASLSSSFLSSPLRTVASWKFPGANKSPRKTEGKSDTTREGDEDGHETRGSGMGAVSSDRRQRPPSTGDLSEGKAIRVHSLAGVTPGLGSPSLVSPATRLDRGFFAKTSERPVCWGRQRRGRDQGTQARGDRAEAKREGEYRLDDDTTDSPLLGYKAPQDRVTESDAGAVFGFSRELKREDLSSSVPSAPPPLGSTFFDLGPEQEGGDCVDLYGANPEPDDSWVNQAQTSPSLCGSWRRPSRLHLQQSLHKAAPPRAIASSPSLLHFLSPRSPPFLGARSLTSSSPPGVALESLRPAAPVEKVESSKAAADNEKTSARVGEVDLSDAWTPPQCGLLSRSCSFGPDASGGFSGPFESPSSGGFPRKLHSDLGFAASSRPVDDASRVSRRPASVSAPPRSNSCSPPRSSPSCPILLSMHAPSASPVSRTKSLVIMNPANCPSVVLSPSSPLDFLSRDMSGHDVGLQSAAQKIPSEAFSPYASCSVASSSFASASSLSCSPLSCGASSSPSAASVSAASSQLLPTCPSSTTVLWSSNLSVDASASFPASSSSCSPSASIDPASYCSASPSPSCSPSHITSSSHLISFSPDLPSAFHVAAPHLPFCGSASYSELDSSSPLSSTPDLLWPLSSQPVSSSCAALSLSSSCPRSPRPVSFASCSLPASAARLGLPSLGSRETVGCRPAPADLEISVAPTLGLPAQTSELLRFLRCDEGGASIRQCEAAGEDSATPGDLVQAHVAKNLGEKEDEKHQGEKATEESDGCEKSEPGFYGEIHSDELSAASASGVSIARTSFFSSPCISPATCDLSLPVSLANAPPLSSSFLPGREEKGGYLLASIASVKGRGLSLLEAEGEEKSMEQAVSLLQRHPLFAPSRTTELSLHLHASTELGSGSCPMTEPALFLRDREESTTETNDVALLLPGQEIRRMDSFDLEKDQVREAAEFHFSSPYSPLVLSGGPPAGLRNSTAQPALPKAVGDAESRREAREESSKEDEDGGETGEQTASPRILDHAEGEHSRRQMECQGYRGRMTPQRLAWSAQSLLSHTHLRPVTGIGREADHERRQNSDKENVPFDHIACFSSPAVRACGGVISSPQSPVSPDLPEASSLPLDAQDEATKDQGDLSEQEETEAKTPNSTPQTPVEARAAGAAMSSGASSAPDETVEALQLGLSLPRGHETNSGLLEGDSLSRKSEEETCVMTQLGSERCSSERDSPEGEDASDERSAVAGFSPSGIFVFGRGDRAGRPCPPAWPRDDLFCLCSEEDSPQITFVGETEETRGGSCEEPENHEQVELAKPGEKRKRGSPSLCLDGDLIQVDTDPPFRQLRARVDKENESQENRLEVTPQRHAASLSEEGRETQVPFSCSTEKETLNLNLEAAQMTRQTTCSGFDFLFPQNLDPNHAETEEFLETKQAEMGTFSSPTTFARHARFFADETKAVCSLGRVRIFKDGTEREDEEDGFQAHDSFLSETEGSEWMSGIPSCDHREDKLFEPDSPSFSSSSTVGPLTRRHLHLHARRREGDWRGRETARPFPGPLSSAAIAFSQRRRVNRYIKREEESAALSMRDFAALPPIGGHEGVRVPQTCPDTRRRRGEMEALDGCERAAQRCLGEKDPRFSSAPLSPTSRATSAALTAAAHAAAAAAAYAEAARTIASSDKVQPTAVVSLRSAGSIPSVGTGPSVGNGSSAGTVSGASRSDALAFLEGRLPLPGKQEVVQQFLQARRRVSRHCSVACSRADSPVGERSRRLQKSEEAVPPAKEEREDQKGQNAVWILEDRQGDDFETRHERLILEQKTLGFGARVCAEKKCQHNSGETITSVSYSSSLSCLLSSFLPTHFSLSVSLGGIQKEG
ncbi:hydrolase [Toxoplasma gondii VAND]|uniref:Hydrolase n=1 Tax=Toxoplasma gondii VAND TaxID=933077 RepID=A0A086PQ53_TOXGO|nr:hydrolase [Toxoplasma gondii VAND]